MTHEEIIAVVKAHNEGKIIQIEVDQEWVDCTDEFPAWNFGAWQYRVKPQQEPTPQENKITKEWLQEMLDCSAASADAYNALGKFDLYNYFRGQQDLCLLLLDEMFDITFDSRVFPIDKAKRKNIIDPIFENYKPL